MSEHLVDHGFTRSVGHPSVFHHKEKDSWTLVHGDDDCSAGSLPSFGWQQSVLEKRYEIKSQRIGEGKDAKGNRKMNEGQVLNRGIRYTQDGYELEADFRHAELIIVQLEVQDAKAVITPGADIDVECKAWSAEPEEDMFSVEECTRYRALAAGATISSPIDQTSSTP